MLIILSAFHYQFVVAQTLIKATTQRASIFIENVSLKRSRLSFLLGVFSIEMESLFKLNKTVLVNVKIPYSKKYTACILYQRERNR